MTPLIIVGAGGHGRSVAEAALAQGLYDVLGFLDDGPAIGSEVLAYRIIGKVAEIEGSQFAGAHMIAAFGSNDAREATILRLRKANRPLATVVHPRAYLSPSARIGEGSTIMPGAIIGTCADLGLGVIVNSGSVVDHDVRIGDFAHLGPSVCMGGGASLGTKGWLKGGTSVATGIHIPENVVVPCGAAINRWPAEYQSVAP